MQNRNKIRRGGATISQQKVGRFTVKKRTNTAPQQKVGRFTVRKRTNTAPQQKVGRFTVKKRTNTAPQPLSRIKSLKTIQPSRVENYFEQYCASNKASILSSVEHIFNSMITGNKLQRIKINIQLKNNINSNIEHINFKSEDRSHMLDVVDKKDQYFNIFSDSSQVPNRSELRKLCVLLKDGWKIDKIYVEE